MPPVFVLMQPNFVSREITYLLLFDWGRIFRSFVGLFLTLPHETTSETKTKTVNTTTMKYPLSWRIGSWMYTFVALTIFMTSLLRMDAFPFYSWSLYNWHPSEPGNLKVFSERTAKIAAHRCLTLPPFNPACLNHGTYKV
jgi:hypothetical protein